MRASRFVLATIIVGAAAVGTASTTWAAPVPGQFVPVGIYLNTESAFGIAYDSGNDLIHYTQGDAGDNLVHTVKPFKNYTAAEIAALPLVNGIPALSLAASLHDVAGTTNPGGSGGSGSGAHFSALAFNEATGQLVQTAPGNVRAYDPFTAANQNTIANVGAGFADGLDFDGPNRWFSPDVEDIFNNGALFIDDADPTKTTLPGWSGLGSPVGSGWAGVEQVADSLFAVAVQSFRTPAVHARSSGSMPTQASCSASIPTAIRSRPGGKTWPLTAVFSMRRTSAETPTMRVCLATSMCSRSPGDWLRGRSRCRSRQPCRYSCLARLSWA